MLAGGLDTFITLAAILASNSSVLLADFLKTFIEFIAVFLSWLAIRRINRGSAHKFDYGLGKMENLVSLLVGLLMALCLLLIVGNAVRNIIHPTHITGIGIWISLGAQVLFLFINGRISYTGFKTAKLESSPIMESQARLHLTRTIANGFILFSLISSMVLEDYAWAAYIDPASSLIIATSLLLATLGIFSTSVSDLLDRTLEESDQLLILRELTRHFEDFEFLHGIRSRRAGSQVFIEILLEFDPEKKMSEVQTVADHLKQSIEKKIQGSRVTIGLSSGPVSKPVKNQPA